MAPGNINADYVPSSYIPNDVIENHEGEPMHCYRTMLAHGGNFGKACNKMTAQHMDVIGARAYFCSSCMKLQSFATQASVLDLIDDFNLTWDEATGGRFYEDGTRK